MTKSKMARTSSAGSISAVRDPLSGLIHLSLADDEKTVTAKLTPYIARGFGDLLKELAGEEN